MKLDACRNSRGPHQFVKMGLLSGSTYGGRQLPYSRASLVSTWCGKSTILYSLLVCWLVLSLWFCIFSSGQQSTPVATESQCPPCPQCAACPEPAAAAPVEVPAAKSAVEDENVYVPHPVPKIPSQWVKPKRIEDKFTICIKTFERYDCLFRLIDSIRSFLPEVRIVVADDSRPSRREEQTFRKDVDWMFLPFDSGLAAGRNAMMSLVETPYFMLLDDDFIFTNLTDVKKMIHVLETAPADIVGGVVSNRKVNYGLLRVIEGVLHKRSRRGYGPFEDCNHVDMVTNFFMGRKEAISKMGGWDNQLRMGEHEDFFVRAKEAQIRVFMCTAVRVSHQPERNEDYSTFRLRARDFIKVGLLKHNLTKALDWKENLIAELSPEELEEAYKLKESR